MTSYELISKLIEVSKGNPNMEVEIRAITGVRKIDFEMQEDAKTGDSVTAYTYFDEYCEDFFAGESEVCGHRKVCITADFG